MKNNIAQTIFTQLGGNKFIAMTGSRNFIADHNSLRFTIARNSSSANRCQITLRANDTYEVLFYQLANRTTRQTIPLFENVYFDQLQNIFTMATGLYTNLGTMTKA